MERLNEVIDEEIIEIGPVSQETKGVALTPRIDALGSFGGEGLTDD